VKLTFLGTGAGNFRGSRRQPSSAYIGGLLLDCGAGATGRLHDLQSFDSVDAVLISHLHSDHVAGLYDFLLHTLITGRRRPLTVVSTPGLSAILSSVFAAKGTVVDPSELYDFRLVEELRPELTIGPWRVRGVPLDHSIPNLGYHVTSDRVSLFYTGDTREPSAASQVPVDYLIHEATFSDRHRSLAQEYGHSTSLGAARAAVAARARRLFLTHVGDLPGTDEEIASESARVFPDSTVVEDRNSFEL
jgi:ribonuclease BN (tRNA processing enzyme)